MNQSCMYEMKEAEIICYICGHLIPVGGIKLHGILITPFSGNQHNECWSWDRSLLATFSKDQLVLLAKHVERLQ